MTLQRLFILCATLLGVLAVQPVPTAVATSYPLDQVILKLAPESDINAINSLWSTIVVDSIPGRAIYLLQLTDPSLLEEMRTALYDPDKKQFCDYNLASRTPQAVRQIVVVAIGDSTTVRDQDALARIRVPEAQAIASGGGSLVAILDTGVDAAHPLLAGHVLPGYDYVEGDADPSDTGDGIDGDADGLEDDGYGHGTMVAGIVATVAPEASILPVRVLDDEGNGTLFGLLEGMYYALDQGVHVINLSLGLAGTAECLKDALRVAHEQDVLVVAAAGNDSSNAVLFPASDGRTIGVTATDSLDVKADFADWSSAIDICAPGVGVYSSYRDGGYGLGEGTSFAVPFVTGTYALLHSAYPEQATIDLASFLQSSAIPVDDIPGNEDFVDGLGSGRIDCYGALLAGATLDSRDQLPGQKSSTGGGRLVAGPVAPNPARSAAALRFELPAQGTVALDVYDAGGRRVASTSLGMRDAGPQTASIPLVDARGRALPGGVYHYRLRAGGASVSGAFVIRR